MKLKSLLCSLFVAWIHGVSANEVVDWDDLMISAVRQDNSGPTLSSRNLAILHVAIYDAVNSITGTHQPYRHKIAVESGVSAEAAVTGAGHAVMLALYPSLAPKADQLLTKFLHTHPNDAGMTNGLALGRKMARLSIQDRAHDRMGSEVHYFPNEAPGQWRRTPPYFRPPAGPHWGNVQLFALPAKTSFLPPPPPALDSAEYADSLNEVKSIGAKKSLHRTPEQSEIAVFWCDFSYTSMPPGHWHEIAASISRARQLSIPDAARLFALLSVAQADAAIVCWDAKYRHNFWRPLTAIRRAAEDNNSATGADEKWDSLLAAPPFPAYVSGHSTFSKASAEVLTAFFKTDAVAFIATSDSLPGKTRSFTSFAACADEVGLSRIYGGIHFSFDNTHGKAVGERIGRFVAANLLTPIGPQ